MPSFAPRKLLVAVIGAAAVNLACAKSPPTGGNLRAPDPEPSALPPTAGNLMAPPPTASAPDPEPSVLPPTSGNLMAPRPKPSSNALDKPIKE